MKYNVRVFSIASAVFALAAGPRAESWKIDANANLTTAINSYSNNWTGGEAGSFTWGTQFLGVAEKQLGARLNTKSTLKLQFGQTSQQDNDTKNWGVPEKSTDLIDGEELLRLTLGAWVDPFVSIRVISQFLDESDSLLDRYGNPLDITETIGLSRTLRKSETIDWSARVGAAMRQFADKSKRNPATGKRKTDITNDGGVEVNMDCKATNTGKWLTFLTSLRLYEALASSKAKETKGTPMEDDWKYPHMKWENTLTLTYAKYLMLTVSAYAYYDKDIKDDFRLKETFSAGLTYVFSKK